MVCARQLATDLLQSTAASPSHDVVGERLQSFLNTTDRCWPGALTLKPYQVEALRSAGRDLATNKKGIGVWANDAERQQLICAEIIGVNTPVRETAPVWDLPVIVVARNMHTVRSIQRLLTENEGFGISGEELFTPQKTTLTDFEVLQLHRSKVTFLTTDMLQRAGQNASLAKRNNLMFISENLPYGETAPRRYNMLLGQNHPMGHTWVSTNTSTTSRGYTFSERYLENRTPFCEHTFANGVDAGSFSALRCMAVTVHRGNSVAADEERENAAITMYATGVDSETGLSLRDYRMLIATEDLEQSRRIADKLNHVFERSTFARALGSPHTASSLTLQEHRTAINRDTCRVAVGSAHSLIALRPIGFDGILDLSDQSDDQRNFALLNCLAPTGANNIPLVVNFVSAMSQAARLYGATAGDGLLVSCGQQSSLSTLFPCRETPTRLSAEFTIPAGYRLFDTIDQYQPLLAESRSDATSVAKSCQHKTRAAEFWCQGDRYSARSLGAIHTQWKTVFHFVRLAHAESSNDARTFEVSEFGVTFAKDDVRTDAEMPGEWLWLKQNDGVRAAICECLRVLQEPGGEALVKQASITGHLRERASFREMRTLASQPQPMGPDLSRDFIHQHSAKVHKEFDVMPREFKALFYYVGLALAEIDGDPASFEVPELEVTFKTDDVIANADGRRLWLRKSDEVFATIRAGLTRLVGDGGKALVEHFRDYGHLDERRPFRDAA